MKKIINGIMVSWPLYHITFKSRVESILEQGLLPARNLEPLGFEQPYPSDDNYVYLFNAIRIRKNITKVLTQSDGTWLNDKEILEVKLPSTHPLEREYDQATITLRLSGDELKWFLKDRSQFSGTLMNLAEDYVRYYFKRTHGIEYEGNFTIKDVCEFIDSNISDQEWNENDGCYRTPKTISPRYLRIISIEKLSTP